MWLNTTIFRISSLVGFWKIKQNSSNTRVIRNKTTYFVVFSWDFFECAESSTFDWQLRIADSKKLYHWKLSKSFYIHSKIPIFGCYGIYNL